MRTIDGVPVVLVARRAAMMRPRSRLVARQVLRIGHGGHRCCDFWRRKRRINLALEGGGAHGAFTWGVLDRLLEDETLDIGWISGTSAGAVNAVALAAGLAEGGRAGARAKLSAVWEAVAKAGVPDLLRINPWLAGFAARRRWPRWRACSRPTTSIRWASTPSASCSRRTSISPCCAPARARAADRRHRRRDRPAAPLPPPRDDRGVRAGLGLPADHASRRHHRRPRLLGRRLLGQSRSGDARRARARSATR